MSFLPIGKTLQSENAQTQTIYMRWRYVWDRVKSVTMLQSTDFFFFFLPRPVKALGGAGGCKLARQIRSGIRTPDHLLLEASRNSSP
jgi:hypothetical protein